jgi:HK97 family phage major capsid protein
MNEALKLQERLKEIAAELSAFADQDGEWTDEQVAAIDALETEQAQVTAELESIRKDAQKQELRAKADEIRAFAKGSGRQTTSGVPGVRIGRVRPAVEDDPKKGFKTLAHFAMTCQEHHANPRNCEQLMQVAAGTGMTQAVNSEGGVLVPPSFSKSIWDKVLLRSNSLLQYCDQIPVDMGNESITIPAINETSRADGSRMGGIQGYWKDELTQMTEKRPAFREVKLTPHELYVFAFISDKLLRHAPQTASRVLENGAADEIAFKIGDAIFEGDGLGKPVGIKTAPCTISVAKETNQPAATIVPANIRKMMARLHPNFRDGAAWFCNIDCLPVLEGMEWPVGTGGVPAYLPPGGMSDSPYSRIYGKPVIPIEYCSTVGTVGDFVLANFQAYAAAIRGMMDAQYSMHLKFDYAQTAYRIIFEVDGQPWLNSAITPFKGSNTLSPFVTLATRS